MSLKDRLLLRLGPPDAEDTSGPDRLLTLVTVVLLIGIATVALIVSVLTAMDLFTIATFVGFLVWNLGAWVVVWRGATRWGGAMVCLGLVAFLVAYTPMSGGVQGPAPLALPVVCLLAALMLGPIAGLGMAIVTVLVLGLLWYVEVGLGGVPLRTASPMDQLVTTASLSGIVAALVGLKLLRLQGAVQREQQTAKQKDDELEQRRTSEVQLRAAIAEATAASEAKSQFLANVSHELRTPLNAIIGYADLLLEEGDGAAEDLERIRKSGVHLLNLINDVLDLSKIEAGRMALVQEEVAMLHLVHEVLDTVRPSIAERSNRLTVEVFEGLGIGMTDGLRVRQILLNLLSNAAKFTDRGEVRFSAVRKSVRNGEVFVFEVEDTGIGIGPEAMRRLFVPFVQGEPTTARQFGGTGLGLSLSGHFARLLGGDLTAKSELGRGSCFTLTLPVASPELTSHVPSLPPGPSERLQGSWIDAAQPDEDLQNLVVQAGRLARAPIALVSLLSEYVQVWPARVGLPADLELVRGTSVCDSLCQFVARREAPFTVNDWMEEPALPQRVMHSHAVRAYLGVPLRLRGRVVGSLCVLDTAPRTWSNPMTSGLQALAIRVSHRLEQLVQGGVSLDAVLQQAELGMITRTLEAVAQGTLTPQEARGAFELLGQPAGLLKEALTDARYAANLSEQYGGNLPQMLELLASIDSD
ncbi:MAG: ATP-binding protein [Myxococcota bacterium]